MRTVAVYGFYTATALAERSGGSPADPDEPVVLRARVRDDLEPLSQSVPPAETLATPRPPYPLRTVCRRAEWARYLAASVDEIDYLNFKDRVAQRLGKRRHDVLLSVWATLRRLEEDRA